jgi:hypothetical protein
MTTMLRFGSSFRIFYYTSGILNRNIVTIVLKFQQKESVGFMPDRLQNPLFRPIFSFFSLNSYGYLPQMS